MRQLTGFAETDRGVERPVDLRLHLYCHPQFQAAYPDLTTDVATTTMPVRRDSRALRIGAEYSWLAAKTRHADLVHHGGGTVPLIGRRPIVLTVHDLQYLRFPEYFSAARRHYLAALMPRSVARATVVATPSEYVRSTVIDAFDADPDRVVVVRHGIPATERPSPELIAAVGSRYGVDGPYVAYAAITHPHKGHRHLVELLATTETPGHPLRDLRLVLLGGEGTAEADLRAAITELGVEHRVVRTGRVPHAERDALLAGAQALVFPSEYEGFGAPLIEAMALGVPVVASAHPAVVEVVGDAGIIVDGFTPDAWSAAVETAIERRAELVEMSRRRRDDFTLAKSAQELRDAYRLAASVGSRSHP